MAPLQDSDTSTQRALGGRFRGNDREGSGDDIGEGTGMTIVRGQEMTIVKRQGLKSGKASDSNFYWYARHSIEAPEITRIPIIRL